MSSKPNAHDDGVLDWLYHRGEETLAQVAKELSRNRAVSDAVSKAFHGAAKTKGRMDKNMQTMLTLLNLPSRTDYQRLMTKIETLQGSLLNVNMKLDRLLAAVTAAEKPTRAPRPRARAAGRGRSGPQG